MRQTMMFGQRCGVGIIVSGCETVVCQAGGSLIPNHRDTENVWYPVVGRGLPGLQGQISLYIVRLCVYAHHCCRHT